MQCPEMNEIKRICDGGAYEEAFWRTRLAVARSKRLAGNPTLEMERLELSKELAAIKSKDTVQFQRQVRKLQQKIHKINGRIRERDRSYQNYAVDWGEEERRLDNLQHAAVYIHRANTKFHFYA